MGVETLPNDLLSDIFLLVDGSCHPLGSSGDEPYSLQQKFRLAQVSAFWRATALSLPLLWANATIRTPADARFFDVALARCASMPLDVRIWWQSHKRWGRGLNPAATHGLVNALLEHRAHLRRLTLNRFVEVPDALNRLLGTGVEFPMLEEITARGVNRFLCRVDISAPQLRSLALHQQHCSFWERLFTPNLHRLELDKCDPFTPVSQRSHLHALIFRGCPNLRDLKLHTRCTLDDSEDFSNTPLRHVRSLSLSGGIMTTRELVDVLRTGFAATIPNVTIFGPDFSASDDMKTFVAELLRGITVTGLAFDSEDMLTFSAYDQATSEAARRSFPRATLVSRCWPDLWAELVAHNVGHTLRVLDFACSRWNALVPALTTNPLGEHEVELHLQLSASAFNPEYGCSEYPDDSCYGDIGEPIYYERVLISEPLYISNLRRIVFTDSGHYTAPDDEYISRADYIGRVLDVVSFDSETVEVCVSRAGLEEDQDAMSVQTFVEKYLSEAWTLCDHCSDAVD